MLCLTGMSVPHQRGAAAPSGGHPPVGRPPVSYKRTDLSRIAPVMLHLQDTSWNLWYDCEFGRGRLERDAGGTTHVV
jgi:hypothetical protein